MKADLAIIGGGAAGIFTAINCKIKQPNLNVLVLEKSNQLLSKVKISGGGRCNVTHHCFEPQELVKFYPRGHRELLSVFTRFNPSHTIQWFEQQGVKLKVEADGRMFPITDNSQTIINCFLNLCQQLNIQIITQCGVNEVVKETNQFVLNSEKGLIYAKQLIIASGSSKQMWEHISALGHHIIDPVPSLFTFKIKNPLIADLMGLSFPISSVELLMNKQQLKTFRLKPADVIQSGPLLITHWGMSGPAILKLSSVAAPLLHHLNYRFPIRVNFINQTMNEAVETLNRLKKEHSKKTIINLPAFGLPTRFWENVLKISEIKPDLNWADLSSKSILAIANTVSAYEMKVDGKSTFKDEFVTAGGVDLKEIDFKTMGSKLIPNLYFAGEVINVDALTGGFNFQAAWSEAWVISEVIVAS
jgi:predicted Rossmann fold flavoprotein